MSHGVGVNREALDSGVGNMSKIGSIQGKDKWKTRFIFFETLPVEARICKPQIDGMFTSRAIDKHDRRQAKKAMMLKSLRKDPWLVTKQTVECCLTTLRGPPRRRLDDIWTDSDGMRV